MFQKALYSKVRVSGSLNIVYNIYMYNLVIEYLINEQFPEVLKMNKENHSDRIKMSVKQQILLGIVLTLMIICFVLYVFLGIDSKWLQILDLFIILLWGILLFGRLKDTNGIG